MDVAEVLTEVFGRVPGLVADAVEGLTADQLATPPSQGANTIGWLVWHLIRVQDHHVSELLGEPQIWEGEGWAERFGLTADAHNTGYGHDPAEVAEVRAEGPAALIEYLDAVHRRTIAYLETLAAADLDRVVDERWDPPVTLGVRLVSVADDDLQHAGQANYARGQLGF